MHSMKIRPDISASFVAVHFSREPCSWLLWRVTIWKAVGQRTPTWMTWYSSQLKKEQTKNTLEILVWGVVSYLSQHEQGPMPMYGIRMDQSHGPCFSLRHLMTLPAMNFKLVKSYKLEKALASVGNVSNFSLNTCGAMPESTTSANFETKAKDGSNQALPPLFEGTCDSNLFLIFRLAEKSNLTLLLWGWTSEIKCLEHTTAKRGVYGYTSLGNPKGCWWGLITDNTLIILSALSVLFGEIERKMSRSLHWAGLCNKCIYSTIEFAKETKKRIASAWNSENAAVQCLVHWCIWS